MKPQDTGDWKFVRDMQTFRRPIIEYASRVSGVPIEWRQISVEHYPNNFWGQVWSNAPDVEPLNREFKIIMDLIEDHEQAENQVIVVPKETNDTA